MLEDNYEFMEIIFLCLTDSFIIFKINDLGKIPSYNLKILDYESFITLDSFFTIPGITDLPSTVAIGHRCLLSS